jgi:hypothetical protein
MFFHHKTTTSKETHNEKTSVSHHNQLISKQLKKKSKKDKKRQKAQQKSRIAQQKRKDKRVIYQLYTTIRHHFPDLFEWMCGLDDCRKKASHYELAAHLTACLAMFIFKTESRNGYNQLREKEQFRINFKKLFGFPMPHGDSVNNVIEQLDETQVEILAQKMVQALLKQKKFHKTRYRDKWFRVAVDGSGVVSFDHQHCEQCLHSTSRNGKTTWYHNVLDARLVTPNGFSISLATQWIENPEGDYDKQDCERKAFQRLAIKLKKAFPRLPIILLVDGLYPYEGFFATCEVNNWAYSATFKDGCLRTVWEEVQGLQTLQINNRHVHTRFCPNQKTIEQTYQWVEAIDYNGHTLNWLECREKITDKEGGITESLFTHITNLPIDKTNIIKTSATGRLRWKIENEGFNTLKNGGYGMQHKWVRKSYQGLKNYYQFMQMGYLINQLLVKSVTFQKDHMQGKNHPTLKSIWSDLTAYLKITKVKKKKLEKIDQSRRQFILIS